LSLASIGLHLFEPFHWGRMPLTQNNQAIYYAFNYADY
jgi:hypothetical protein